MRLFAILIFLLSLNVSAQIITGQHCGYDFTSYLVVNVKENGKEGNIKNLRVVLVDSIGKEVVNFNNSLSWSGRNEVMLFKPNYKIDSKGKKLEEGQESDRWFFPFAKDSYILSVTNTFKADDYMVRIEDVDGNENNGYFKTETIPLYSFNMYILCSSENERQAQRFGPRTNRPIEVYVEKH
ncbi:MAG: hypothetical protein RBT61_00080 [Candidatus Kapabacteria bacterium]|nr:hypothetical protein [Candidatus Kapabacteria bacterium]